MARNALEFAEVANVFARGESRVEAGLVGEDAETGLGGEFICDYVVTVDVDGAAVGFDEAVDHAQRGGFPRAVGAEEASDGAVGGGEGNVLYCSNWPEYFSEVGYADHLEAPPSGLGPAGPRKKGGRSTWLTQLVSSLAELPSVRN